MRAKGKESPGTALLPPDVVHPPGQRLPPSLICLARCLVRSHLPARVNRGCRRRLGPLPEGEGMLETQAAVHPSVWVRKQHA